MIKNIVEDVMARGQKYWTMAPVIGVHRSHTGALIEQLHQEGQVQIERVTHGPWGFIPRHRHPDVDSFEFPLWGSGELWIKQRRFILDDKVTPWKPMFIAHSWFHGGRGYERGGCFLSVQIWFIAPVRSITENWINES